jgi:hypothetical protein
LTERPPIVSAAFFVVDQLFDLAETPAASSIDTLMPTSRRHLAVCYKAAD